MKCRPNSCQFCHLSVLFCRSSSRLYRKLDTYECVGNSDIIQALSVHVPRPKKENADSTKSSKARYSTLVNNRRVFTEFILSLGAFSESFSRRPGPGPRGAASDA